MNSNYLKKKLCAENIVSIWFYQYASLVKGMKYKQFVQTPFIKNDHVLLIFKRRNYNVQTYGIVNLCIGNPHPVSWDSEVCDVMVLLRIPLQPSIRPGESGPGSEIKLSCKI